jgi:ubiquinone/menaquinone biosynthesis C-methylase UbiE
MDHPAAGDVAPPESTSSMKNRLIADAFHGLNIMALMYFRPATLIHKINALPWYQGTLRTWSDSLGYQTGESILEVGCATGQLTKYMARRGAIAYGVDKSTKMLRKANASDAGGTRFKLASAMDLPFENNRFDYIIAASLLNIISQPELALREMARVCKPDGKVSVLVPQAGMMDEDIARLANELNLSGFSRAALATWHRRAPKMQLEKLLEYLSHAGLRHICSETYLNGMVVTVTGTRVNASSLQ